MQDSKSRLSKRQFKERKFQGNFTPSTLILLLLSVDRHWFNNSEMFTYIFIFGLSQILCREIQLFIRSQNKNFCTSILVLFKDKMELETYQFSVFVF